MIEHKIVNKLQMFTAYLSRTKNIEMLKFLSISIFQMHFPDMHIADS